MTFTEGGLASMRATVDLTMTTAATHLVMTRSSDPTGHSSSSWVDVGTEWIAVAQPGPGDAPVIDRLEVQGVSEVVTIRARHDLDVKPGDRFVSSMGTHQVRSAPASGSIAIERRMLATKED